MNSILGAAKMLELITFGNKCVFIENVITYVKKI